MAKKRKLFEKNKERKNWFKLKWGRAHSFGGLSKGEESLKKRGLKSRAREGRSGERREPKRELHLSLSVVSLPFLLLSVFMFISTLLLSLLSPYCIHKSERSY